MRELDVAIVVLPACAIRRPQAGRDRPRRRTASPSRARARAAARRRCPGRRRHARRPADAGQRDPDPRTHAGSVVLAVARRARVRRPARGPRTAAGPGLRGHSGYGAGAGNRCQHRDVQRRPWYAVASAAVSECRAYRARRTREFQTPGLASRRFKHHVSATAGTGRLVRARRGVRSTVAGVGRPRGCANAARHNGVAVAPCPSRCVFVYRAIRQ